MKDSLCIHKDNVSFLNLFEEEIYFEVNDDSIDSYIHKSIIKKIAKTSCKIIFIKENLSENYMELYGIRVAYHIRLSEELGQKRYLPIVILSEIDAYLLGKLNKEANILFSKNIFVAKNEKEQLLYLSNFKYQELTKEEYQHNFLDLIQIDAPSEYESHHDIANEWAIYRWANILGLKSKTINNNYNQIQSLLYFKYLKSTQLPQMSNTLYTPKIVEEQGKILYIDDEWNKGWGDILIEIFKPSKAIEFEPLEYDYKNQNKFKMLSDLKCIIEEKMPDVVVLDLRFTQSDHKIKQDIDQYTGIKIAKMIKEINPGIQTIMMSATSQSLIVQKLYEYGVLGYIKKEHPKDISINTEKSIDDFLSLVEKGFERSYLKEVWDIQRDILALEIFDSQNEENRINKFKENAGKVFDILDSNMKEKEIFSALTIFRCLEAIADYFIREEKDKNSYKMFWRDTDQEIEGYCNIESKINNVAKRLQIKDDDFSKEIKKMVCFRNYQNHSGKVTFHCKDYHIENINQTHFIKWFKIVKTIIITMDKKENTHD